MRSTGLSEFIEPCGTSAICARRSALMLSSSRSESGMPANHTSPASIRPGGLIMRKIASARGRLPGAGFAGQPETLSRREGKAHIVNRLHQALRVVESHPQALDPQDGLAHMLLPTDKISP